MKTIFTKNKGLLLVVLIIVGVLFFVQPTLAADWAARMLAGLISVIISAIGYIIGLVVEVLIYVAQYNGFIKADAVTRGWEVVRDLSNMFFVLVLLIISFATILHIENYSYKKYLPKLLLMAILINFSKTLAGLVIDFAQVIMLTFVNGFKDIGQGNLVHMMGLKEVLSVSEDVTVSFWTVAAAYLLGLLYVIIALVIITAMLATLVMRIVMIWIYVVLAPLAFLLGSFPGGQKYFSQWWGNFSKEVIIGPVLAFFIWLSFVSVTITSNGSDILKMDVDTKEINVEGSEKIEEKEGAGIPTEAADPEVFIRFIVSVGLLLGGLMVSKQIGAGAGKAMDKTVSQFQKGGQRIGRTVGKTAGKVAYAPVGWASRGVKRKAKDWGNDVLTAGTKVLGVNLRFRKAWKSQQEMAAAERARKEDEADDIVLEQAGNKRGGFKSRIAAVSMGGLGYKNWVDGKLFKNQGKVADAEDDMGIKKEAFNDISSQHAGLISQNQEDERLDKVKKLTEERNKLSADDVEGSDKIKQSRIEEINQSLKGLENPEGSEVVSQEKYEESEKKKDEKQKEYNDSKEHYSKIFETHAWTGITTERTRSQQESDSEALKIVAGIEGMEPLVQVFREALASRDTSLARVSAKKLAKTGNFNEIYAALGLGTDTNGIKEFGENFLKAKGGFSDQAAKTLIADMGELAKPSHHYSAFGAVKTKSGKLEYATEEEHQAAQFAEMSKIQIQRLVRDMNRLGGGAFKGSDHSEKGWDLSDALALIFASKDKQFASEMEKTGNMNLVMHIGAKESNLEKLKDAGAPEVAALIRKLMDQVKSSSAEQMQSFPEKAIKDFRMKMNKEKS